MTNNKEKIERSVLGNLIYYPNENSCYIGTLREECFSDERRTLFRALSTVSQNGKGYDKELILNQIRDPEHKCKAELEMITDCASPTIPINEYISLLLSEAQLQFIRKRLVSLLSYTDPEPETVQKIVDEANKQYSLSDSHQAINAYDEYLAKTGQPKDFLKTGVLFLDKIMTGLQKGTLTVIGARQSVGKTAFSLNIAQNVAEAGKTVYFFSLEMSFDSIVDRLISRGCEIDYTTVQRGLSAEQQELAVQYFNGGLKERLIIIPDVNTIEGICNRIMIDKPDLAIVDYAQIIQSVDGNYKELRILINYITASLKSTAKRTDTRVILLSQLRRLAPSATTHRIPSMEDLKESGSLGQDADYVLLLSRAFVEMPKTDDNKKNHPPYDTDLIIEKNRYGRVASTKLFFDGAHQSFNER